MLAQEAIIVQKTPTGDWDVTIDWSCPSRDLGADTILTSTWAVSPSGLTLSDAEISPDDKKATIWISGGTTGAFYAVTNTITTTNERVLTGTFIVQVVEYIFLSQPHYV